MATRTRIITGVTATLIVLGACSSGEIAPSSEPEPRPTAPPAPQTVPPPAADAPGETVELGGVRYR